MPSKKPRDLQRALTSARFAAPVQRQVLSLGAFTANTTVTTLPRFIADRRMVIREVWIACSAIPADADGVLTVTAKVFDVTEAADDTIISAQDLETLVLVANKAYKMTLAAETTENEQTMEAGDTLRFELISNSAAIDTNANVSVVVIYQPLQTL